MQPSAALRSVAPESLLQANAGLASERSLRCLWVARYLPYPLDAGAKVYSARLAASLVAAGAHVKFMGYGDAAACRKGDDSIEWIAVRGTKRNVAAALWSPLPLGAAIDATTQYRRQLDDALQESWDAIVLDGYATGWALSRCLKAGRKAGATRRPLLVHVAHNHEASVWASMAREARGGPVRRLALKRNSERVRLLEQALVESADLVTAITDEDRLELAARRPSGHPMLTLSPGYTGWVAPARTISPATPRHVLLMGSFNWVVKRENLRRLVAFAEPLLERSAVTLDIVGDVPHDLREVFRNSRAMRFHGYVDDVAPCMAAARLALVPELIGGGFKLKFLDYFFGRVPVVTIAGAATGLSTRLRECTLQCQDLESLVATLVRHIDDYEMLNDLQQRAFACARHEFHWADRGRELKAALVQLLPAGGTLQAPAAQKANDAGGAG